MQFDVIHRAYTPQIRPVQTDNRQQQNAGSAVEKRKQENGQDRVELSAESIEKFKTRAQSQKTSRSESSADGDSQENSESSVRPELAKEDQAAVDELKSRDQEVRVHEQAHLSAAGGYATSGARFTFETGPDGKRYAVGGEVSIDTSTVPDDPEATIRKMQTVRKAALAPMNPSAADRAIAAEASATAAQARAELLQQNKATLRSTTDENGQTSIVKNDQKEPNTYQFRNGISAYEYTAAVSDY